MITSAIRVIRFCLVLENSMFGFFTKTSRCKFLYSSSLWDIDGDKYSTKVFFVEFAFS